MTHELDDGKHVEELRQEIASLRRALVDHPAAQTLRFVAPFIRDAIAAGVWNAGTGTESVEREVTSALAWLDKFEGGKQAAQQTRGGTRRAASPRRPRNTPAQMELTS